VTVSTTRIRTREPDQVCAEAVDLARSAAVATAAPFGVGDHLGLAAEGDRVVTHLFECLDPAYFGWRWAVTVARAPRSKVVTVDETVLLPGPESLLAPDWVPWQDRLRPGDLGVGDLLPAPPDDERLVPLVTVAGDDAVVDWFADELDADALDPAGLGSGGPDSDGPDSDGPDSDGPDSGSTDLDGTGPEGPGALDPAGPGLRELGAGLAGPAGLPARGRSRVLSAVGRESAAERWYDSEHGPRTPLAHAAPAHCVSCGFFVPLSGELGQLFGACANAYAPDDGRVVSADHGCGAHSEAVIWHASGRSVAPVIDEFGYDMVDLPGVSVEETVFEPLSHGTD
jgi:Protein of unknown function (DUF3027)